MKCPKYGKIQYRTKIDADIAAAGMAYKSKHKMWKGTPPRPCVSYLCRYCNNWHLTTSKSSTKTSNEKET